MPIFRFKCNSCQGEFEVLSRYHDAAPACLSCGSTKVEKCLNVIGSISSSKPSGCRAAATCPSATAHCCHGGGCGCTHE